MATTARRPAVPFFWSQHYDVVINYIGHAERWDRVEIDGSAEARDFTVVYRRGDRPLAIATVSRDRQSLAAEAAIERRDAAAVEAVLAGGVAAGTV